ncbi:3'-5' exonuclease [Puniceicoccaceae bacterium K14]|nr:3'-5' exonuclease [Puniceicoccaceae bacterium K14]
MKPLNSSHLRSFHPLLGVGELIAFDLETTGLRYKQEEITQIAGVKMGGMRMEHLEVFETYVNPGKPIPPEIQDLTQVRDHHVQDAPKPFEALKSFSKFVSNHATLFGHDIYRFDFNFIRKTMKASNDPGRLVRFVDTMDVFEVLWPDFSRLRNTLDDIAERLSAGLSSIRRHDAKGDAVLLSHIFQRIQDHPDLERICSRVPVHEDYLPSISALPDVETSNANRTSWTASFSISDKPESESIDDI